MQKFDDEIKKEAIKLYVEGLSAQKVSEKIGCSETTVRNWLKDSNISIRSSAVYNSIYDKELVRKISQMYEMGLYTSEIEENLSLKRGIASYLLRKNGYTLRHRGPKSLIEREDFFDVIDSEEKAYFLGWIMADGNISINNGQYSLKIHISLKDKELIDKFLCSINSKNKTAIKKGKTDSYYVSLTSVHMCKRLIELGVKPRKSGHEVMPPLSETLKHHFIRWVFDGDGITSLDKHDGRSGFVGSKNMLESILNEVHEKLTLFQNKKNENIYYFLGGKRFSRKLYEYMYKDVSLYLERKKHRLEKIGFD